MTASVANHELLVRAAVALGPITPRAMFVGGSIVGILAIDAATPPRPTDDVDVAIEVATTIEYQTGIGETLRSLGFEVDTRPGAPICRWLKDGLVVDVMPVDGDVLGFRNTWYRSAFAAREQYPLTDELSIPIISAPFFLATKLEAFFDRGKGDYLASADLEDIITVVDGRPSIVVEAGTLPIDARQFLATHFSRLLADRDFVDALPGHLGYGRSPERLRRLNTRLVELSKVPLRDQLTTNLPMMIPNTLDVIFTVDGGARQFRQVDAFEHPESMVYFVEDGTYLYVHPGPADFNTIEAPGRVLVAEQCRIEGTTAFVSVTIAGPPAADTKKP